MIMENAIAEKFLKLIDTSIQEDSFHSLELKNKRLKDSDLRLVKTRLIDIKGETHLSFTYRYPTQDITKNFIPIEALTQISDLLEKEFFQGDLITASKTYFFNTQHKVTLKEKAIDIKLDGRSHDIQKNVALQNTNKNYLYQLGITSKEGHVLGKKRSKYNQINKYIEIVEKVIEDSPIEGKYRIYDMGSGKAYLSFALYDHLKSIDHEVQLTGIELRDQLVDVCNKIARDNGFEGLTFEQGYIGEKELKELDILIALHACDTATDDAIYQGIRSDASIIICSPCCHKQVRKSMKGNKQNPITQHGILEERLAEMLTDTIRALILEAHGYKAKIIEFISSEHTAKNLMLIGVKKTNTDGVQLDKTKFEEIKALKETYGIQNHYLEDLITAQ